jgi:hypothetical protein
MGIGEMDTNGKYECEKSDCKKECPNNYKKCREYQIREKIYASQNSNRINKLSYEKNN